jgi:hypothetical protein
VDEDDDPQGPGTAVIDEFGPLEVCEGEESEGAIYLEGVLVGVVELVDLLLAEGECLTITVEIAAQPEGAASLPAAELPVLPPSPTP